MVKKVGLPWPPAPFVSIRNLACLAFDVQPLPPSTVATDREWMNWGIVDGPNAGYLFAQLYFTPQGPHEIASAIREAEAAGKTIRALGSGWGFSNVALPEPSAVEEKYPDDDPLYYWEQAGELEKAANDAVYQQQRQYLQAQQGAAEAAAQKAVVADKLLAPAFGYGIDTSGVVSSLQPLLAQIILDHVDAGSLFFVEAGRKLSDLNTLLDQQSPPVALKTLGGSHGQSLAGAISTGTHGGDFDRPPLADSVRAIYLIGAQGTHHWIEPTKPLTDPAKIARTFPCIRSDHIHYDDDTFHSVLVSMGSMGVTYAVVLDVVPQYSLLNWHKQSTWEQLRRENGADLSGLFDGSWTGMKDFLKVKFGSQSEKLTNRFVEVVACPIKNDDGSHICYASNRVELPSTVPASGVKPGGYSSITQDDITNAVTSSSDFGFWQGAVFAFSNFPGYTQTEEAKELINFCQNYNYYWAIRAVIKLVLDRAYPIDPLLGPKLTKGTSS